jgi:predicted RNase H-like nuclease (RuvC/YqgF family)
VLVDSHKGEITVLTMQVQTLNERLTQAGEETRAAEDHRDAALRALSEKESELARLMTALNERSVLANSHKAEIAALTMQVQTLDERLTQGGEETKAVEERRDAALRALSENESVLARLTSVLEERSVLVDSQKVENAALRTQGRMLNERLIQAGKEARAVEEHRDVERSELKAATQNLMEERSKFENFHRHVADLLQQLTAQRTDDEILNRRAREDLENRLIAQSRLLNKANPSLRICAARSKSRAKPKTICASPSSRSMAERMPPSRTSTPRRPNFKPRSIAPMVSAHGLSTSSPI